MKCRQCGAEIAEKALICYRCGTATTEPAFKPPSKPRPSSTLSLLIGVLAIGLIALVALVVRYVSPGVQTPRVYTIIGVAVGVLIVALRAYLRRR